MTIVPIAGCTDRLLPRVAAWKGQCPPCYRAVMQEHEKLWDPLTPQEVWPLFRSSVFPWWIAGGYAIEHFVGRSLRSHDDIDVLVLRKDSSALRSALSAWDCWAADPPGQLRPWTPGETLPQHVDDVWCRAASDGPWRFQIMLDDGDRDHWRSRRCRCVTKPVPELRWGRADGVPFLVPEVQLFYKAQAPRPKDVLDLQASLPLLSHAQRTWLKEAIATAYGQDNAWLRVLDAKPGTAR